MIKEAIISVSLREIPAQSVRLPDTPGQIATGNCASTALHR